MNFGQHPDPSTFQPTAGGGSRIVDVVVIAASVRTKYCRQVVAQRVFRFVVMEIGSKFKSLTKYAC